MNHQQAQQHILARKEGARPATRKVLRFASWSYLSAFAVVIVAHLQQLLMAYGIHTHPPILIFGIAHCVGIFSGLACGYFGLYALPVKRRWLTATSLAALSYALVFSAFAWAIPSLTVHFAAQTVTLDVKVRGATDAKRGRQLFCGSKLYFGPHYAPGGSICYNHLYPRVFIGSTLQIEGKGNSWATLVTQVNGSRS